MSAHAAATAEDTGFSLERRFAVTPERLWAAWTDPDALSRWFDPRSAEVLESHVDLRVGGRYRIVMRTPNGETLEVGGAYQEVEPPHTLSCSWAWSGTPERESLVTVRLLATTGGTELTLNHNRLFDRDTTELHLAGWPESLEKLTACVG